MKSITLMACLACTLTGATRDAAAAPVIVSTLPSWNGSASIGDFGSSGFSAWGQFFVAPSGTNRLLDFTFLLSDGVHGSNTHPVPVVMQAHLVQYNPLTRLVIAPTLDFNLRLFLLVRSLRESRPRCSFCGLARRGTTEDLGSGRCRRRRGDLGGGFSLRKSRTGRRLRGLTRAAISQYFGCGRGGAFAGDFAILCHEEFPPVWMRFAARYQPAMDS